MPTPRQAFAVVASTLERIDPEDRGAVTRFYQTRFVEYPPKVQALISDFLIGQTAVPSDDALRALKQAVTRLVVVRKAALTARGPQAKKAPALSKEAGLTVEQLRQRTLRRFRRRRGLASLGQQEAA